MSWSKWFQAAIAYLLVMAALEICAHLFHTSLEEQAIRMFVAIWIIRTASEIES